MANKRSVASINSPEYDILLQVIREAREGKRVSQRELARRLGMFESYIVKIENRERRVDTVEFIKIAVALDMEPNELFASVSSKVLSLKKSK